MYEHYHHLTEKPFGSTADPQFLYESESHTSAVTLLREALARRECFAVVTGDVGMGKTTLCRALLDLDHQQTFTALLQNPCVSEEDLLANLLRDLGVVSRREARADEPSPDRQELFTALHAFLRSLVSLGAVALLIVDEAQAVPPATLEQIRQLSDLTADTVPLLQIVLVGQLELSSALRAPALRLLDRRLPVRYRLAPLTEDETAMYIAHRLAVAGGSATVTFTPSATRLVYQYSGGSPRVINSICHRALRGGYMAQTSRIDEDLVRVAAGHLELKQGSAEPPVTRRTWFGRRRRSPT